MVYEHLPLQQQERTTWQGCRLYMEKGVSENGAVHWHMLLWIEPGNIPDDAVVAEKPRPGDSNSAVSKYLRRIMRKVETHDYCIPKFFQKPFGLTSDKCKYGCPYNVLQEVEELDEDNTRYLYPRRHEEDRMIVPHNLECLWFGVLGTMCMALDVLDQIHL